MRLQYDESIWQRLLCVVFYQANLIVRHPLRGFFYVIAIRFLGLRSCLATPQALVRHPLRGLCHSRWHLSRTGPGNLLLLPFFVFLW